MSSQSTQASSSTGKDQGLGDLIEGMDVANDDFGFSNHWDGCWNWSWRRKGWVGVVFDGESKESEDPSWNIVWCFFCEGLIVLSTRS